MAGGGSSRVRGAQSVLRWLLLRTGWPLERGPFLAASSSSSELSVSSRSLRSSSTTCGQKEKGVQAADPHFPAVPQFPHCNHGGFSPPRALWDLGSQGQLGFRIWGSPLHPPSSIHPPRVGPSPPMSPRPPLTFPVMNFWAMRMMR